MPVFVGPGSAPAGGFEGKSDRVGLNTATSDPGSAVVGDMYVQTVGAGATLRLYDGSTWANACQVAFSASGGNTTETVSGNVRHIFTGPGNFVVNSGDKNINILVVGGGGGGGQSTGNGQSAGAGAGGFRLVSSFPVSGPVTYPITVGPAGSGSGTTPVAPVTTPNSSKDGGNSIFGSSPAITGTGGGGGGGYTPGPGYTSGQPGGSGGGDGSSPQEPGSGNVGGNDPRSSPITEGFDGGASASNNYGTGGGGAAQAGQGPGESTGPGGIGAPVPTAIAPTSTGTPGPAPGRYFAGGGGGSGPVAGTGGAGGGGSGGSADGGNNGTPNTGGGGGGAQAPQANLYTGGNGGTGIVIVSYSE